MDPRADGRGGGRALTAEPTLSTNLPVGPGAAPPASGWAETEASIRLRRGAGGTVRVEGSLCTAPLWLRWDGATLWLVGSGASPVGDDFIRVRVDVESGITVAVRSVAATVVYAARGAGTRWHTELHVADGASLHWRPDPVILTGRARHEAITTVHAAAGAKVMVDDVLVLGRAGERAGQLRSTMDVRIDEVPTLLASFDTSLPGWMGPGGVDGATVVASRLRSGDGDGTATVEEPSRHATVLHPAPGCRLAIATAVGVKDARRMIEELLPSPLHQAETNA